MRAAQICQFGEELQIREIPDPSPPDGGVVLKIEAAGVCRSDWHAWQGHDDDIKVLPHVPGHEFAGCIAAIGHGLEGWEIGDRVTAPFVCGCGQCRQCQSGNTQVCTDQYQPGFYGPGAFVEYVALPFAQTNLVRLPDSVDFSAAASLGCRFATAYRALAHPDQANVQPGERVAIFGCGGVGLSAITIAKSLGAEIIAIDIRNEALENARNLGAAHTLHAKDATNLDVDVSVDALGTTETCIASINALAPRGRHVQIGLMVGEHSKPEIPIGRIISKELRVIGSHGMGAAAYPEMLQRLADGSLQPEKLVVKSISLDELPAEMASMSQFSNQPGITIVDRF